MKYNSNIISKYTEISPLALALERIVECRIYPKQELKHPILDIGCGEGMFAHVLFADKIDVGIDPNSRELDRARQLGAYSELLKCKGNEIPKPDNSFKTVISNSVLEHIPDLMPVLKEAHRILESGGEFYFTVPTSKFEEYTFATYFLQLLGLKTIETKWRKFFNKFWAHYHYYTPEKWSEICKSAGFEVLEVYTYSSRRACMINTFLTPFGLPGMIIKKLTNRWVLVPWLRRIMLVPLQPIIKKILAGEEHCEDGGLVFVSLRKP